MDRAKRSCRLTCAFTRPHTNRLFLWGFLKNKVYATKPETIDELQVAIEREFAQIPNDMILDVCDSVASRCQQCLDQNGHPLPAMSRPEWSSVASNA